MQASRCLWIATASRKAASRIGVVLVVDSLLARGRAVRSSLPSQGRRLLVGMHLRFRYCLDPQGRTLVVTDPGEMTDDLVRT